MWNILLVRNKYLCVGYKKLEPLCDIITIATNGARYTPCFPYKYHIHDWYSHLVSLKGQAFKFIRINAFANHFIYHLAFIADFIRTLFTKYKSYNKFEMQSIGIYNTLQFEWIV